MKHWEKIKKDPRRVEEPVRVQSAHDHKKKKLKPVEKVKYRLRAVPEEEEEE